MTDDKFIQLMQKLSEVAERTAKIEEKCTRMEADIDNIKEQDIYQNDLLDKHILGVQTNTQRLELEIARRKSLESRVNVLESFPKFRDQLLSYLKSTALWLSAVGGAALLLDKFFKFL